MTIPWFNIRYAVSSIACHLFWPYWPEITEVTRCRFLLPSGAATVEQTQLIFGSDRDSRRCRIQALHHSHEPGVWEIKSISPAVNYTIRLEPREHPDGGAVWFKIETYGEKV